MAEIDISGIFDRVKNVLVKPKETFQEIKSERSTMQDLIVYLAIIGIPTLIGVIIGWGVVGYNLGYVFGGFGSGYRVTLPIGWAIGKGITQYVGLIVGMVILGFIINALAPTFKSKQDQMQAMKIAAYMATPALIAGILYIWVPLAILVLLASLYGLYLLYVSLPIMMGTPQDQQMTYFIVTLVLYIVIIGVVDYGVGGVFI